MSTAAARPAPTEYAAYYRGYVDRVPEGDVVATLERQLDEMLTLLASIPETKGGHRYEPGKWSIKELIGHINDAERIFAYRALRIGRGDATPLPGFEQDGYIATGRFDDRTLADLADEFGHIRRATLSLVRGFDDAAWARSGTASDVGVSARAVVYILAGHAAHHTAILRERYLAE
jgi:hypothetical protein